MKKSLMLLVVASATLAGCMHPGHHREMPNGIGSDPTYEKRLKPTVDVVNNNVTVDPPFLYFLPHERDVEVSWQLPPTGPYRFANNDGIVIEGELVDKIERPKGNDGAPRAVLDNKQLEVVNCKVGNEGLSFTCRNRHTRTGIFKYTIRLVGRDGSSVVVDPPIVNW
jgi:hypothetical protein